MLRRACVVLGCVMLTLTCSAQAPGPGGAPSPLTDLQAVRAYYEAGLKRNGIVGSSLVILHGKEIVFRDDYGLAGKSPDVPVDDTTTYHWASCTKSLTGIAIMQLRDRGLLSLDDPLIKYIPELVAVHDPFGPVSRITIRHMMTHSGGFRDATWPWHDDDKAWQPFEPTQWSQIVAMLPYTDVAFEPGTKFSYSNLGVVFLGEIIERLSGDPYAVYMEKNVLRPLGMGGSYFDRSPYSLLQFRSHSWDLKDGKLTEDPFDFNTGITRSNGGLNAPLGDMIKYLWFLVGDTTNEGSAKEYESVLKRSSLEEMWRPFLPVAPDADFESRKGARDEVATSFFVHTDGALTLIGHAGWQNGFRSHFYFDPASHRAYIVAYNTDAQDAKQNTRGYDFELRDYLINNFFKK